jgi:hypothetical protein
MNTTHVAGVKYPATEKQDSFIRKLIAERDCSEGFVERTTAALVAGTLPKSKASEIIDWLMARPLRAGAPVAAKPTANTPYPDVPAGRYAVESLTGTNDLDFLRVDRPTEGKWSGRTFVKRVIGGHSDVAVRGAEARKLLEAVLAAGPTVAGKLYADELGRCMHCGRHLTDATSRAYGIGPHCRGEHANDPLISAVLSLSDVLS